MRIVQLIGNALGIAAEWGINGVIAIELARGVSDKFLV